MHNNIVYQQELDQLNNAPYVVDNSHMIGGSFFGDLWSGIKKGVSKGVEYVKDHPELVATAAKMVGLGKKRGRKSKPKVLYGGSLSNVPKQRGRPRKVEYTGEALPQQNKQIFI